MMAQPNPEAYLAIVRDPTNPSVQLGITVDPKWMPSTDDELLTDSGNSPIRSTNQAQMVAEDEVAGRYYGILSKWVQETYSSEEAKPIQHLQLVLGRDAEGELSVGLGITGGKIPGGGNLLATIARYSREANTGGEAPNQANDLTRFPKHSSELVAVG